MYVAFITDVFAGRIVGWSISANAATDFVMVALNQAIKERQNEPGSGLIHHSDRGVQYVSVRYSDRLEGEGIFMSVGSVGDSYDNAMAERDCPENCVSGS